MNKVRYCFNFLWYTGRLTHRIGQQRSEKEQTYRGYVPKFTVVYWKSIVRVTRTIDCQYLSVHVAAIVTFRVLKTSVCVSLFRAIRRDWFYCRSYSRLSSIDFIIFLPGLYISAFLPSKGNKGNYYTNSTSSGLSNRFLFRGSLSRFLSDEMDLFQKNLAWSEFQK